MSSEPPPVLQPQGATRWQLAKGWLRCGSGRARLVGAMGRNVLVLRCANGSTADAGVPLSVLCGGDGPVTVSARTFHEPPSALADGDASMSAVIIAGLPTNVPLKLFHEVLRVLVPGGVVQTSYTVSEHTIAKTEESVNADLLMGGFVGSESAISTVRNKSSVSLSVSFTATKPDYGASTGSLNGAQKLSFGAQKLKLRKPVAAEEDDDDMVDEDELLDMAPAAAAPAQPRGDDCETGRGACANCTCGRAEAIYDEEAAKEAPSACGNCYLGDAFRCASCPHRGKAPFEPGETPAEDLEADVGAEEVAAPDIKQGGKVTLNSMDEDLDFD